MNRFDKPQLLLASALCAAVSVPAFGGTPVWDQIGPDSSASDTPANGGASQDFEAAFDGYDVVAIDDFTLSASAALCSMEAVIQTPTATTTAATPTAYRVEIYSSQAAAGASLIGDVYSVSVPTASVTITEPFGAASALVVIPISTTLAAGTYWAGVIPVMAFTGNGQTFVSLTTIADTTVDNATLANPGGSFGFGPFAEFDTLAAVTPGQSNFAYRLNIDCGGDPCPEDVDGNGDVNVDDLIAVILGWGLCSGCPEDIDGNGDVNVDDLIAVILAWGLCP